MCHTEGFRLEARKIIRQGNANPLFWSITEPSWVAFRSDCITKGIANNIYTAVAKMHIE